MTPRRRRLAIVAAVLLAVSAAAALVLHALRSNLVFFYTPSQVAAHQPPAGRAFRLGGLVRSGSLRREGLAVQFDVTDFTQTVRVRYQGVLPDLFREGRGVVAQGLLGADGVFVAQQVLAKHDERYAPPAITPGKAAR